MSSDADSDTKTSDQDMDDVLKFLEEEIQSFEKLFAELNGRTPQVEPPQDLDSAEPSKVKPEIKPKPILMKKGEKPKTLPKPKVGPKVAPKPTVHFPSPPYADGGTEV